MSTLIPTDVASAAMIAEYLMSQSIEKARRRLLKDKGDDITKEWGAQ